MNTLGCITHDSSKANRDVFSVKEPCTDDDLKDKDEPTVDDCKAALREQLKKYGVPKDGLVVCKSNGAPVTTIMLRNVPYELGLEELIHEFEEAGFGNHFDLVYLPLSKQKKHGHNRGYAYVNLKSPSFASQFRSTFHKQRFRLSIELAVHKPLHLSTACVQGFSESLRIAQEKGLGHAQSGLFIRN